MATAKKTSITRSSTINVKDTTIDDITAAATKVGAPTTARLSTGPNYTGQQPVDGEEYLPHSVTFSWTEEV